MCPILRLRAGQIAIPLLPPAAPSSGHGGGEDAAEGTLHAAKLSKLFNNHKETAIQFETFFVIY